MQNNISQTFYCESLNQNGFVKSRSIEDWNYASSSASSREYAEYSDNIMNVHTNGYDYGNIVNYPFQPNKYKCLAGE